MTDLQKAAQQALDAIHLWHWAGETHLLMAAHDALRTALAQPEQEPVAWMSSDRAWMWSDYSKALAAVAHIPKLTLIPLYTTPPQRQWVGLTKVQQDDFADAYGSYEAVCAIEQALKERNT